MKLPFHLTEFGHIKADGLWKWFVAGSRHDRRLKVRGKMGNSSFFMDTPGWRFRGNRTHRSEVQGRNGDATTRKPLRLLLTTG
jgi:hypothetical protein